MSRALRCNFLVRANSAKLVGSLAFPVLRAPGIRFISVLHEHGPAQAAQDDRLTRSATSPEINVRKILDTSDTWARA